MAGNSLKHGRIQIAMLALLVTASVAPARGRKSLGEIDFFGYRGFNITAIRSALPFHEGDLFPPAAAKSSDDLKRQVSEKVKRVIGQEPTDISFVCCDARQNWMVYIGLPGGSWHALAFNPSPTGSIRFSKEAVALRQEMDKAWMNAVMKGHATEDDSEGFALSNDPQARKAELAIRDYALRNEARVLDVLTSSFDAHHRAIAAQMLGYGRQSREQIDALVRASLDPDDGVRNDAVRALEVLAGAKPDLARMVPTDPFIQLLRSGKWPDHNKASLVLVALTQTRDQRVLDQLRTEALDSLLEMAQWRNVGHAEAALSIIGRIAGIDEETLNKLIESHRPEAIIEKVHQQ